MYAAVPYKVRFNLTRIMHIPDRIGRGVFPQENVYVGHRFVSVVDDESVVRGVSWELRITKKGKVTILARPPGEIERIKITIQMDQHILTNVFLGDKEGWACSYQLPKEKGEVFSTTFPSDGSVIDVCAMELRE